MLQCYVLYVFCRLHSRRNWLENLQTWRVTHPLWKCPVSYLASMSSTSSTVMPQPPLQGNHTLQLASLFVAAATWPESRERGLVYSKHLEPKWHKCHKWTWQKWITRTNNHHKLLTFECVFLIRESTSLQTPTKWVGKPMLPSPPNQIAPQRHWLQPVTWKT